MLAFTVRLQEGRCLVVTAQAYLYTVVCVGASVIYADTVADLGYADELGNYAEYSGAPNQQVIKPQYCKCPAGSQITSVQLSCFAPVEQYVLIHEQDLANLC